MYDERMKTCIYNWREKNKQKYNDYMRNIVYIRHADVIKEKRMKKYYLEKEMAIFRNILLF